MKFLSVVSAVIVATIISGCGTFLNISELNLSPASKEMENPDGLVINRRGQYKVDIVVEGSTESLKLKKDIVTGVDHNKVIKLDVTRMPFSDGKLNVKLNEFQLMKEVELTSKTGASKAATAAQTGIDKHLEIKTILKPEPMQNNKDGASK